MERNIYYISNRGTVTHYCHFFLAVLVPLIYYDIKTNSKYNYIMKINLGNMFPILKFIFKDRISFDYIKYSDSINDRLYYFDIYIQLLKNRNDNDVLLNAFDIFFDSKSNLTINNYNNEEYKKLKNIYVNYYYYSNKNNKPENYKKLSNDFKRIKTRYKQLLYTRMYIKLIKIRPFVIDFFEKAQKDNNSKKKFDIVLIERKIPKYLDETLFKNVSGARRIIYNHIELKNKLCDKYQNNFINVILEDLNIYEQFNIFRNAKTIISQHGAGLVNIFFCKKIKLIEIMPEWNEDWFVNIANFLKFDYVAIKQNRMTKNNFLLFNKKYNIIKNINIDKIFMELDKETNKLHDLPIVTFIKNSGSVDINEVLTKI